MSELRPYIVQYKHGEWAMLAFARSNKEARKVLFEAGFDDAPYIDTRARLAISPFTRSLQECDAPHIIDSPPVCPICERWNIAGDYDPCPCTEEDY